MAPGELICLPSRHEKNGKRRARGKSLFCFDLMMQGILKSDQLRQTKKMEEGGSLA